MHMYFFWVCYLEILDLMYYIFNLSVMQNFYKEVIPVCGPISHLWEFLLIHTSSKIVLSDLKIFSQSGIVTLLVFWICIPLNTDEIENCFVIYWPFWYLVKCKSFYSISIMLSFLLCGMSFRGVDMNSILCVWSHSYLYVWQIPSIWFACFFFKFF